MLYLSAIVLAFFLSIVLITKRNKTHADYILVAWLGISGVHLLSYYFFSTNQNPNFPTLFVLGFPLPFVHGPFLYLYTSYQTASVSFNKKHLLHFLPIVLSSLLFAEFHFLSFEQKVEVIMNKGKGYELQMLVNRFAIYASGIVYVILSLSRLLKYKKNLVHQFSNTEKINFNWLLYLIIWMMLIWIVILFTRNDKLIFGSASLFVIWIGYFSIKQVQVFSQNNINHKIKSISPDDKIIEESSTNVKENIPEKEAPEINESQNGSKYQNSSLSENDVTLIYEKLKVFMYENKPYTNPDLTLNELSKGLEVHPNHLSQVINSKEHKNFYDLINERRVEEFKKLVSQSSSQKYTLMALAYDCGFNSKATFNRNFKKYTGLTPTDYLKNKAEN